MNTQHILLSSLLLIQLTLHAPVMELAQTGSIRTQLQQMLGL